MYGLKWESPKNVGTKSDFSPKKNKENIECDKSTVTCDVGTAQCEDGTIKCEKKIKEPSNVTNVQSHMMLILRNVRMVP